MSKKKSQSELSKREKFEQAGRFPVRKAVLIGLAVVIVAVGGSLGYYFGTKAPAAGGEVVAEGGEDYSSDAPVQMALLSDPTVLADSVEVSATEVKERKIGGFIYKRTTPMPAGYGDIEENGLPILAYVSPSGRLVVASSLCEPCHSYTFHIEGDDLVCNACFTRWNLDTLEAESGGCQAYPPEEIEAVVEGDKIIIQKSVLENWVPRV